eukprot:g7365.t1
MNSASEDEQLSRSQNLGLRGREIDENPPEPDIEEIQAHPAFARQVSFSSDVGEDSNKAKMRKGTAFVPGVDSETARAIRRGTGFVAAENRPESEDEEDEAPAAASERKVTGVDSETARAIRRGTGFVATENLPESEDEEDEAPAASSERKVSFSHEAGTDSETAKSMRKGTAFVPMSAIARLPSGDDTADEADEIRHVSFSAELQDQEERQDSKNSGIRKGGGTGHVKMSELPDDDEGDETPSKKVSFVDADADGQASQISKIRNGTGFVAGENLPETDDDEDEEPHITTYTVRSSTVEDPPFQPGRKVSFSQEPGVDSETAKAMRKGTGFVAMENLPDSDESEDELLEEAPAAQPGRKVSFSSEGGIDVQKAHAMRKGTGFVATENLPETDESEGEGEGTREIEVPTNPPERKVSFSQVHSLRLLHVSTLSLPLSKEVGIDGLQANTLRKGTGFVPMANLPDSEDEEEEDDCDYEEDDFDPEDFPKTTGSEA